jgi:hypothetical protein
MMTRFTLAITAIFCAWFTQSSVCAQELAFPPESEELAVEVDLLDECETDAALWSPEFLSAGAFTGLASQSHVYSSVDFAALSASDDAFQTDGDFVMTPRFQLGWESDSGWGVRGTYWEYENDLYEPSPGWGSSFPRGYPYITFASHPLGYNRYSSPFIGRGYESLDFDTYFSYETEKSQFTWGGGVKAVHGSQQQFDAYREINSTLLPGVPPADVEQVPVSITSPTFVGPIVDQMSAEGFGPTLFAEWRHPFFMRETGELAIVLGGRTSFVPSDYEFRDTWPLAYSLEDDLWINEGKIGLELSRRLQRFVVRLRGQFETQAWNSSVMDDQAFTGVSTSLGVEW